MPRKRMTVPRFVDAKSRGYRLSMLTAYDNLFAQILDEAGIDAILVGDSLAMVVQGHSTTLPVTIDEIIYHCRTVVRGVSHALVIADMPFLSFHVSPEQAVESAGRLLKEGGAAAVKLEGGVNQATTIQALAAADIPVMAHVGMRPQSVNKLGGMGRIQRDESRLIADARAAQDAGAFGIVLELIPKSIARAITAELQIPTIGIGAGPHCDGQVLVTQDMLGMTDFAPKFLKRFAHLREEMNNAVRSYIGEIRDGAFPDDAHSHE